MPHRNYISIIFAPEGEQKSFAVRLKKWQLTAAVVVIVLGWFFFLGGIVGGIVIARSVATQRQIIAENRRLREALIKADTLRQELEQLRAMKRLLEQALFVATTRGKSEFERREYIPQAMKKSDIFLPNRGIPELGDYLEHQWRIEAYIPDGLPAEGVISARFGETGGIFKKPHSGVDIVVAEGTPVRATANGIVAAVDTSDDYGIFVDIDHLNGYHTVYAHLSAANASVGMPVSRGDIIGYSGHTGRARNPHIHYEVRYNGKPIDPLAVAGASDSQKGEDEQKRQDGESKSVGAKK